MTEQERDFKGVWIPKEVWLDKRLSALDKIIFVEIDSLDSEEKGCFASNKYIAEFCQCSETKVSKSISLLIKLGYLYLQHFDGRQRELKSRFTKNASPPCKKDKADYQKVQDTNIVNNKVNNIVKRGKEIPSPEQILDLFNNICKSLAPAKYLTDSRKEAIESVTAKYTIEQITECFRTAESSPFLTGTNDRKWKATFDWLIQEDNMVKVLEGNFSDPTGGTIGFDLDEFFTAATLASAT